MGRYLVIGIATQLAFKKKEAETVLESVEKAKKTRYGKLCPSRSVRHDGKRGLCLIQIEGQTA